MRRTAMKRSAWPRRAPVARQVVMDGARPPSVQNARAGAVMAMVSAPAAAIPKEQAVRSEEYRRLVAALPCAHCGIVGFSQAAHPPPTGKGIKEDDRECFPLCCTRPLITGCHVEFDQYRLIPGDQMREQAARWGSQTRKSIVSMGKWPANLPTLENPA